MLGDFRSIVCILNECHSQNFLTAVKILTSHIRYTESKADSKRGQHTKMDRISKLISLIIMNKLIDILFMVAIVVAFIVVIIGLRDGINDHTPYTGGYIPNYY